MIDFAVVVATTSHTYQGQLTYNRPGAMLPALGKPMVVRTMDRLHRAGITDYVVVVGESEGEVAAYLTRLWKPNVKVEFELLPNNRTLRQSLAKLAAQHNKPFLVANYNSFTHAHFPHSMLRQHEANPNDLLLGGANSSLSKTQRHYYGWSADHRVLTVTEQPIPGQGGLILSEIAIFGEDTLSFLKEGSERVLGSGNKHLIGIVQQYVRAGGSARMVETSWTLQVETDFDLLTVNKHLLDEGVDAHVLSEMPYSVQIIPPVRIDPQVSVGQGAKIGPYVYLEHGARVGQGAEISNAIVLTGGAVRSETIITNAIITSRGSITHTVG